MSTLRSAYIFQLVPEGAMLFLFWVKQDRLVLGLYPGPAGPGGDLPKRLTLLKVLQVSNSAAAN